MLNVSNLDHRRFGISLYRKKLIKGKKQRLEAGSKYYTKFRLNDRATFSKEKLYRLKKEKLILIDLINQIKHQN